LAILAHQGLLPVIVSYLPVGKAYPPNSKWLDLATILKKIQTNHLALLNNRVHFHTPQSLDRFCSDKNPGLRKEESNETFFDDGVTFCSCYWRQWL
jgi:hypothetical protein